MKIDIRSSRDRIELLHDELSELLTGFHHKPAPGSPCATEAATAEDPDYVPGTLGQCWLLYESAADHILALVKTLTEPLQTIAPFTCIRSALEVASIYLWILDPAVDYRARLRRSYALRLKGFDEQLKLVRENPHLEDVARIQERYAYVARKAKQHHLISGEQELASRRPSEFRMPPSTELVERAFGARAHYRISSAVVHGHLWAITQMGFAQAAKDVTAGTVLLKKSLPPEFAAYLLLLGLECLSRPAWTWTTYCGCQEAAVTSCLNKAYDDLHVGKNRRFWSQQTP